LPLLIAALAIVDMGAVIVIALFYTGAIAWSGLAIARVMLLMLVALIGIGVRSPRSHQCC
jgi:Na+:H+ antiporter, NhaA family